MDTKPQLSDNELLIETKDGIYHVAAVPTADLGKLKTVGTLDWRPRWMGLHIVRPAAAGTPAPAGDPGALGTTGTTAGATGTGSGTAGTTAGASGSSGPDGPPDIKDNTVKLKHRKGSHHIVVIAEEDMNLFETVDVLAGWGPHAEDVHVVAPRA